MKERLIVVNPAREAKRPRRTKTEVKIPTDEAVAALLQAARDDGQPWLVLFLLLAAETGLRRGELTALRWADVDLEARRIDVRGSVNQWVELGPTKTGEERTVPLTNVALEALTDWRAIVTAEAREDAALDRREPDPEWFVFYGDEYPQPRSPDAIGRLVTRLRQRNPKLERVTIHQLRHYFISRVYSNTANIIVTAKLAGHADGSMIAKVYGHPVEGDLENAVATLNRGPGDSVTEDQLT